MNDLKPILRHPRLTLGVLAMAVLWYGSKSLLVPLILLAIYGLVQEARWFRFRRRQLAAHTLEWPGAWTVFRERRLLIGWPVWKMANPGRVAHVRRQWEVFCTDTPKVKMNAGKAKRYPYLGNVQPNVDLDITCTVNAGKLGLDIEDLAKHRAALAKVIGCQEVTVKFTQPGSAAITFHWAEPLGRILELAQLPASPKDRLSYGRRLDGSAASVHAGMSVLIGGLTRHGKSNTIWNMLADANRKGLWIDLYVSDPKRVELPLLGLHVGDQMGRMRVRKYVNSATETTELVETAHKGMLARQSQQTNKNWLGGTKDNPLVIIILDELLPLQAMIKKGVDSPLGQIMFTGAASGYVVWANAQIGHAEVLGVLRNLIPQRISVATPTADVTDTILGTGAAARGAACHLLNERGLGWAGSDDSRELVKFRGAIVRDADMEVIALGGVPEGMSAEPVSDDTQVAVYSLLSYPGVVPHNDGAALLYVGQTNDLKYRWSQHRADSTKPWCGAEDDPDNLVDWEATVLATAWYPNLKRALAEEKKAIRTRMPIYNDVHNHENPGRRIVRRRRPEEEPLVIEGTVVKPDEADLLAAQLLAEPELVEPELVEPELAELVAEPEPDEPDMIDPTTPDAAGWPVLKRNREPQSPNRPPRARRTRRPHPTVRTPTHELDGGE